MNICLYQFSVSVYCWCATSPVYVNCFYTEMTDKYYLFKVSHWKFLSWCPFILFKFINFYTIFFIIHSYTLRKWRSYFWYLEFNARNWNMSFANKYCGELCSSVRKKPKKFRNLTTWNEEKKIKWYKSCYYLWNVYRNSLKSVPCSDGIQSN